MRRFLPALILAIVGGALGAFLASMEMTTVRSHLVGFPDADATAHLLRPGILVVLCFIPALAAFFYGLSDSLDRYLIRSLLSAFILCFSALFSIWLIGDLTENISDFRKDSRPLRSMGLYYAVAFPKFFVDFAPFGLLLAMLYSLGKLSRGQEIVSIIQTGRGVARLIFPLIMIGFMVALICLGFNYHWAPTASAYQDALQEKAKKGTLSKVSDVVYHNEDENRLWFIGGFPYDYHKGEPLRNVIVRSTDSEGQQEWRLQAERAEWDRENNNWTFHGVKRWNLKHRLNGPDSPLLTKFEDDLPDPLVVKGWNETPWQLIKLGLRAEQLGIPGLYSWLVQNQETEWGNKRRFLTQWHYRWAQPGICLAIVFLAAPLGIVFSRRGTAGGIALAIFLCAGMLFASTVFLSLGESGYIPPFWAAWGTNVLATAVAMVLIQRRLFGRPIYQTLRKLLPL